MPYASYLEQHGALQSLEKLLGLVHESGFILVNDYGQTQPTRDEEFEHQRFSLATFVGLNFPQLQEYFGESHHLPWVDPNTDDKEQGIHTRLFCRRPAPALLERYRAVFGKAAHDQLNEPVQRARQCLKVGRFELAAENYYKAIAQQPGNWVLLNEASSFLTFQFGDPKAGVELAKVALSLNPSCSAELWNTLGDGLYAWGRFAESRSAYQRRSSKRPCGGGRNCSRARACRQRLIPSYWANWVTAPYRPLGELLPYAVFSQTHVIAAVHPLLCPLPNPSRSLVLRKCRKHDGFSRRKSLAPNERLVITRGVVNTRGEVSGRGVRGEG